MEITFHLVPNNVARSRVYCTPPRVSISGGHDSACSACQASNRPQIRGLRCGRCFQWDASCAKFIGDLLRQSPRGIGAYVHMMAAGGAKTGRNCVVEGHRACSTRGTTPPCWRGYRSRVVIKYVCHVRATNLRLCCYEGGGGRGRVL